MGYSRDEILKAWDDAIGRIAQDVDDPTLEEMAAATAEVCAKFPGLNAREIGAALAFDTEEIEVDIDRKQRAWRKRDTIFDDLPKGTLTFEEAVCLKSKQGDDTARVFKEIIDRSRG